MLDEVKTILCEIHQLEMEGNDSFESGQRLGKLYSKLKSLGYIWNTRIKQWVYDYDNIIDTEEEDPV